LFDFDALIKEALRDPKQLWRALDSFWRHRTEPSTRDLVQYLSFANLLLYLNVRARSNHFVSMQNPSQMQKVLKQPWLPIVIFKDQLEEVDFIKYGDGFDYDDPPEFDYGDGTGTSTFRYPLDDNVFDVKELVDSVTETRFAFDASQFDFDRDKRELAFDIDPFTIVPSKTLQESGREYIVLWARNIEIDLEAPFRWNGFLARYSGITSEQYVESLKILWRLIIHGPNTRDFKSGLMAALGFPFAKEDGVIRRIDDDGHQLLISTDETTHKASNSLSAVVQVGDEVEDGTPLTDGVKFFEYEETLLATDEELPALSMTVPLSTGKVVELLFRNFDTVWDFEAGRPSEWRFPISGEDPDIEQFWVDVDTFATANGIDLETTFGLPDVINPMRMIIDQLLKNNLFVASLDNEDIPVSNPAGFADRARKLLLSPAQLIVIHQDVGSVSDAYDLGVNTSETVGFGYHALPSTEVISVPGSGTDLTFFDYAPMVATS